MINMQIVFSFAEIWGSKSKNIICLCYFFKQGYLSNYIRYCYDFFYDSSSFPFRGKGISDFVSRPSFTFYVI